MNGANDVRTEGDDFRGASGVPARCRAGSPHPAADANVFEHRIAVDIGWGPVRDPTAACGDPALHCCGVRVSYRWSMSVALLLVSLLLTACGNMKHQNYLRPEEPSLHLPHGTSAQLPPAHTVPHVTRLPDSPFTTGERDGKLLTDIPIPVTPDLLARGRERFDIYCAVCHGPDGYGRGIVVRRGFPAPPSYHEPRLRNAPVGHFFQVITHGYGMMYSYADRLDAHDRWAVAAYIRALQLSQHARVQDLAQSDRERLNQR